MSDAELSRGRALWRDRLPWLILLRAFRPAISARMLVCAGAGLAMTIAGWRLIWRMFAGSADPLIKNLSGSVPGGEAIPQVWPAWPWGETLAGDPNTHLSLLEMLSRAGSTVWQLTLPFQYLFHGNVGFSGAMFSILCGLWALAVWSFLGGAMTRTFALQFTREETIPWRQARAFAMKHWFDYFTAPLYPLLGVLLAAVPVLVLGFFARWDFLALLVGLVWPLALFAGLFMAMLLLGLAVGWPLMWSTVSVEGNDAFDALSRSYAYVFRRPLQFLFYVVVASVLGGLGYILVQYFAEAVLHLTAWAASWGSGYERISNLNKLAIDSGPGYYAVLLFAFWNALIRLIAAGFVISYLWSATTAIYLLLRRDVDATELDEIQLEQDERFGLPPLVTDDRGVPGAADVVTSGESKPISEEG